MRWLFPFISAVVGGLIAGWAGAVIGFAIGCVVAATVTRNRELHQAPKAPQQTAAAGRQSYEKTTAVPTVSPTVHRLHEIMRQIDSSQSAAGSPDERTVSSGIGVSISFGNDEAPAQRGRTKAWLRAWPGTLLHFADYDRAGLRIFASELLSVRPAAGLSIPDNLEALLSKRGSRKLFLRHEHLPLLQAQHPDIARVNAAMNGYRKALEQESLLY